MKRTVCTQLDEPIIRLIDRMARRKGVTRAEMLRTLIQTALELYIDERAEVG